MNKLEHKSTSDRVRDAMLVKNIRWATIIMSIVLVVLVILYLLLAGYRLEETGFSNYTSPTGEFERQKTLWNWLELLLLPVVLGMGFYAVNRTLRRGKRDRIQEQTLQHYLDRVTDLLSQQGPSNAVKATARLSTLTTLRQLDEDRREIVRKFLAEAESVYGTPIVDLTGVEFGSPKLQ